MAIAAYSVDANVPPMVYSSGKVVLTGWVPAGLTDKVDVGMTVGWLGSLQAMGAMCVA